MWIFLTALFVLIAVICIILLLPVLIIIKTDGDGVLQFRYKILFKTFGEDPDPNNVIVKALKNISGVSRLDSENIKKSAQSGSVLGTIKSNFSLVVGLIKRLLELIKKCKVRKFNVDIVCVGEDAAAAAVEYGAVCAFVYPALSFIRSALSIDPNVERVKIGPDFNAKKGKFKLEIVLAIGLYRVIGALLRAAFDEAERMAKDPKVSAPNSPQKKKK